MSSRSEDAPLATAGRAQPDPRAHLDPVDGLTQLSFVIVGMLERRAAEHDLSVPATRLLGVLRDREPTMHQLARLLELDKSSVTGLVDRAERRGLVARVPSPTDRRAVLVRLTDEGRALVSAAADRFGADVSAMLGLLPLRDRAALDRIVTRVLVAYAAAHGIDLFADTRDTGYAGPSQPALSPSGGGALVAVALTAAGEWKRTDRNCVIGSHAVSAA